MRRRKRENNWLVGVIVVWRGNEGKVEERREDAKEGLGKGAEQGRGGYIPAGSG